MGDGGLVASMPSIVVPDLGRVPQLGTFANGRFGLVLEGLQRAWVGVEVDPRGGLGGLKVDVHLLTDVDGNRHLVG
jgi:hypothetical protein